ncbi:MAG: hypothetical protein B0D92_08475 [Spirochaeta sp. LUC14_002_19_P3]|nr:MAG: hypothetical protein B0D92_08475 [Spirochaeta sp. LUC14_002_19_P3]
MKDYYRILGIPPSSSETEIRRAYRRLAKDYHPDRGTEGNSAAFLALSEAYEILISPEARASYDSTYRPREGRRSATEWNYRDFLMERKNDPATLAKLICFDLLHEREDEAVLLYNQALSGGFFSLRAHLDREDFMDYAFLLAEAYLERKAAVKAYRILRGIATLEEQDPYFRHFYADVLERLASIARGPLPGHSGNALRMAFLADLTELAFPAREKAQLYKQLSELLSAAGKHEAAARAVFRAYSLAPKMPGLKDTVEMLRGMGFTEGKL